MTQVTEDAKFLHLDSRILALEQNASGGVEGVESDIEVLIFRVAGFGCGAAAVGAGSPLGLLLLLLCYSQA